eukprot:TRINITY_DN3308_c0_g1_i1.p1 TRINITY_DN3308_c0_g1~~TRINITY_DN3308_c0_g1_i1.p1  ORF type:complete len:615 (+),score=114.90 TRINITY_DN3308_c0_g1_i1:119-1846(+)
MDDQFLLMLVPELSAASSLQSLDLSNNSLRIVFKLCEMLLHNSTIETLNLSRNEIGSNEENCSWIGNVLSRNNVIQNIDLEDTKITNVGCSRLVEGLKLRSGTLKLNLSANEISDTACTQLLRALEENKSIADEDLHSLGQVGSLEFMYRSNHQSSHSGNDLKKTFELSLEKCKFSEKVLVDVVGFLERHSCVHFAISGVFRNFGSLLQSRVDQLVSSGKLRYSNDIETLVRQVQSFHVDNDLDKRFTQILGKGTFGTVYAMRDDVAVKQLSLSDRHAKRYLRELELWSNLSHRGIVQFHGLLKPSESVEIRSLEIAMKRYDMSLFEYLKRQRWLSLEDRLRILYQVSSALRYLHFKGIIHRDLHSRNVLVKHKKENLRVSICDFGLSVKLDELREENEDRQMFYNTFGAMTDFAEHIRPPECSLDLAEARVGNATDVFAFGVLMWQVLSGREPRDDIFDAVSQGTTVYRLIQRATSGETGKNLATIFTSNFRNCGFGYTKESMDAKTLDDSLRLMLRCLDDNPTERPAAAELCDALASFLNRDIHLHANGSCLVIDDDPVCIAADGSLSKDLNI